MQGISEPLSKSGFSGTTRKHYEHVLIGRQDSTLTSLRQDDGLSQTVNQVKGGKSPMEPPGYRLELSLAPEQASCLHGEVDGAWSWIISLFIILWDIELDPTQHLASAIFTQSDL